MTITIPPAALEAACEAYEAAWDVEHSEPDDWFRAAIAAALAAWPGMRLGKYRDVAGDNDRIILPLPPQEASDDQ